MILREIAVLTSLPIFQVTFIYYYNYFQVHYGKVLYGHSGSFFQVKQNKNNLQISNKSGKKTSFALLNFVSGKCPKNVIL